MSAETFMPLAAGISGEKTGKEVDILGHTYWYRASSSSCFVFETYDPPNTGIALHVHPDQDEFILVLENELDLVLGDDSHKAKAGDLVKMPRGIPHSYHNNTDVPTRALFWVTPAGDLENLFDNIAGRGMDEIEEILRISSENGVDFLPPEE